MGMTSVKMKGKWIFAQKSCGGDIVEMKEEFMDLPTFYQQLYENYMSETTLNDLETWMEEQTKDLEHYIHGDLTDLEESFHKTSLKFWKKGVGYETDTYIAKRALAALYWNENFGKSKQQKGHIFLQEIANRFGEYMRTRAKGIHTDNEYIATRYGITDHWNPIK